ncbi:MAG: Fis family transcriptional regulator [Burkholderiales bacterium PBB3]|nr:MAG: Fis family transcriptional regulator [Burkholderiales bacterium PBB3]
MPAVLLVEDDAALRGYLASALEEAGFTVQLAQDRASAVAAMALPAAPAIAVLDLGLPPQPSTMREGLLALQDILRLQPPTKVIVLTGQDESAAAQEAVRLGAFDFLTKPTSMAVVLQAVQRASLFAREEARMVLRGESRIAVTVRLGDGPKEAGAQAEEQLLRRSLAAAGYNVTLAARQLGVAREHLYYYLNKYGIQRPD